MTASSAADWLLVVPVKGGAGAKSRLHPPVGVSRAALAAAMARDCLAACVAGMPPGRVFVVTADASVAAMAAGLGAVPVADPGDGLNAAVVAGIRAAHESAGSPAAIAALLGDLPALRPGDLTTALGAATAYPLAFVPDAHGTGTVLITATVGSVLAPRFGERSAQLHEAAGHRRLDLDLPRLRTDVDDDASLRAAITLGVGRWTAEVLLGGGVTLPVMQASIHRFHDETGAGSALLDDGREVHFSAEVFAASALRHVRQGQRVSIDLDPDTGTIQRLWIVGIGDDQRIG
jgi:2-phospho-L-lactate guanylyltransferase